MLIESVGQTSYDKRKLPVPVDVLPPSYRIATSILRVKAISKAAAKEKALQDHNHKVIREAFEYRPLFTQEIVSSLRNTHELLREHGYHPETGSSARSEALDERVEDTLDPVWKRYKQRDQTGAAHDIAHEISKIVHPDKADPTVARLLPKQEQSQVLSDAFEAARKKNATRAQDIAVNTLAPYLVEKVNGLLQQGKSFEQIAKDHPDIASQMDYVQYLAHLRLPDPKAFGRMYGKPEEADRKAQEIRRKADIHARTAGTGAVYDTLEDVISFAKSRQADTSTVNELEIVHKFMEVALGLVGGTGQFEIDQGSRIVTPRGLELSARVEDFIRVLPVKLHSVAQALVSEDLSIEDRAGFLLELRGAIEAVRSSARNYGNALEYEANRGRSPYGFNEEKYKFSGIIFKENKYNNNNNKNNN